VSDIVQKLWGFCHTLRHDGVDYGDYMSNNSPINDRIEKMARQLEPIED